MKLNKKIVDLIFNEVLTSINHEVGERYVLLYSKLNLPDLEKELLSTMHSKLDSLAIFMNSKAGINRHFNADKSRELLEFIQQKEKIKKAYSQLGYQLILDSSYSDYLSSVKLFLENSGGSTIPDTYNPFEIMEYNMALTIQKIELGASKVNIDDLTWDRYKDDLEKLEVRVQAKDNEGVLTICRSLIELQMKLLYSDKGGTAPSGDFKKVSKKFFSQFFKKNQDPEGVDLRVMKIQESIITIIENISTLRNRGSDSHGSPEEKRYNINDYHALLVANLTRSFLTFFESSAKRDDLTHENSSKL